MLRQHWAKSKWRVRREWQVKWHLSKSHKVSKILPEVTRKRHFRTSYSWWPRFLHILAKNALEILLNPLSPCWLAGSRFISSGCPNSSNSVHSINNWYLYTHWRRQWHPTPVFLPGKSHGRRSLVDCSPWGHQESDTTEWLHFHFHFHVFICTWSSPPR